MQSTFAPIELGKRGLVATTQGIQTVGHNLSNASVEGYSRQRVEMSGLPAPVRAPAQPRTDPRPDRAGRGGVADRADQDMLLEGRIVAEQNLQGTGISRDKYILMMEQVYNEPTDHSVRALMDQFWSPGRISPSIPPTWRPAARCWSEARRSSTGSTTATGG